jgi:uncharacterized protein (TIGR03118 family)
MKNLPLLRAAAVLLAMTGGTAFAAGSGFDETILVANDASFHPTVMVDPYLVNPWGIALRPPGAGGHIWISNAGDGTTTTYIGDVNGVALHQDGLKVVPIDQPAWTDHGYSQVTGQVYNAASDISGQPTEFSVSGPADNWSTTPPTSLGTTFGPAKFVFVSKDGTINAWRTNTASGMTDAVVVKDYSGSSSGTIIPGLIAPPVFTGVAMTTDAYTLDGGGNKVADNRLYTTDFENSRIMVFDNQWNDITASVPFQRPADVDATLSPFNIQELNGILYVAYAQVLAHGEEPGEEVSGPGLGHIVGYDRNGNIVADFTDTAALNTPWGMAIAPAGFGDFGGDLLVGNFGDGTIAAYDPATQAYKGQLKDAQGNVVSIDGLWGLTFGNGVSLGDANSLYFTAGANNETNGIFGKLTVAPVPEPSSWGAMLAAGLGILSLTRRFSKRP